MNDAYLQSFLLCLSDALVGKAYVLCTHSNDDVTLDELAFW